jgi:hypothetical protein
MSFIPTPSVLSCLTRFFLFYTLFLSCPPLPAAVVPAFTGTCSARL